MDEILKIVFAFLGGAVLASFGYTLAFSMKLSSLQATVASILTLINKPAMIPSELMQKLTEVCTLQKEHERRIEQLENTKLRE